TAELLAERDALRKELAAVQQSRARGALDGALDSPRTVGDLKVVTAQVEAEDRDALLQLGDHVRDRLGEAGVVVLAAVPQGKPTLLVTVTPDLVKTGRAHAGNLVKTLAAKVGGRGGGKPGTAQAGLPDTAALAAALAAVDEVLAEST
ncbi:alanine--tRNA ligase, partial [bacterium]|nr:alanine--tRNA ligase [bacterium]